MPSHSSTPFYRHTLVDHVSRRGEVIGTACDIAFNSDNTISQACEIFVWCSPSDFQIFAIPSKYLTGDIRYFYPTTVAINSSGKLLASACVPSQASCFVKHWFVLDTKTSTIVDILDLPQPENDTLQFLLTGLSNNGFVLSVYSYYSGCCTPEMVSTQITDAGASPLVYYPDFPSYASNMNNDYVEFRTQSAFSKIGSTFPNLYNFTLPTPSGPMPFFTLGTFSDNNLIFATASDNNFYSVPLQIVKILISML